jgi:hypothetical protein
MPARLQSFLNVPRVGTEKKTVDMGSPRGISRRTLRTSGCKAASSNRRAFPTFYGRPVGDLLNFEINLIPNAQEGAFAMDMRHPHVPWNKIMNSRNRKPASR